MPTVAATWTLGKANQAPAESTFGLHEEGTESTFGDDGRTLVNPADFSPGGKYRCTLTYIRRMCTTDQRFYSHCQALHAL